MSDGDPHVEVPKETHQALQHLRVETSLPMKEVVRRLVDDAYNTETKTVASKYERLLTDDENTVV